MMPRLWVAAVALGAAWLVVSLAMSMAVVNRPEVGLPVFVSSVASSRPPPVLLGVVSARKYAALEGAAKELAARSNSRPALVELVLLENSQSGGVPPAYAAASDGPEMLALFATLDLSNRQFGCIDLGEAVRIDLGVLASEAGKWPTAGTHVVARFRCAESATGCLSDQFVCLSRDIAMWMETQEGLELESVQRAISKAPFKISHLFLPSVVKTVQKIEETTTVKPAEKSLVETVAPEQSVSVAVVTMQCASECKVQKSDHTTTTSQAADAEGDKRAWICRHGYKLYAEHCNAVIPGRAPAWGKVAALLGHFESAKYLVWMDSGVQIVNHAATMADLVRNYGTDKHLYVAEGSFAVFVMRTTSWSRAFLEKALRLAPSQFGTHAGQVDTALSALVANFTAADRDLVSFVDFKGVFERATPGLETAARDSSDASRKDCGGIVLCGSASSPPKECLQLSFTESLPRPTTTKKRPVCVISDLVKAFDLLQNFGPECDWALVMPVRSPNKDAITQLFSQFDTTVTIAMYDGPSEHVAALLRAVKGYEEMVFIRDEVLLPSGWSVARFIKSVTCQGPVGFCSLSEVSTAFFYARVDFYEYLLTQVMSESHLGISHQSLCSLSSHFYDWWDPRVTGCAKSPPQGRELVVESDRSAHSSTEQWYRNTFPVLKSDRRYPKTIQC
jgi:hypothetical protein